MKMCKSCGKPVGIPIICSYCSERFCVECRLPEKHNCTNFNSRTAIPLWKKSR